MDRSIFWVAPGGCAGASRLHRPGLLLFPTPFSAADVVMAVDVAPDAVAVGVIAPVGRLPLVAWTTTDAGFVVELDLDTDRTTAPTIHSLVRRSG